MNAPPLPTNVRSASDGGDAEPRWDGQSLYLGLWKGTPVAMHFTLLCWTGVSLLLTLIFNTAHLFYFFVFEMLFILIVFYSEVTYCARAKAHGGEPKRILLWPLGGLSIVDMKGVQPPGHYRSRLSAPLLAQLPLVIGFLVLAFIWRGIGWAAAEYLCWHLCFVSFWLFIYNTIVVAYPLHGACCLAIFITNKSSQDKAAKVFIVLGAVQLVFLLIGMFTYWNTLWFQSFFQVFVSLWLVMQMFDLVTRVKEGPAALCVHPLFNLTEDDNAGKNGGMRAGGVDIADISTWAVVDETGGNSALGSSAGRGRTQFEMQEKSSNTTIIDGVIQKKQGKGKMSTDVSC